jgi:hypothetical protein
LNQIHIADNLTNFVKLSHVMPLDVLKPKHTQPSQRYRIRQR